MSLLRLVLSGTAQRGCQNALPALWTAVASSSATAALQQEQQAAAAGPATQLLPALPGHRNFHAGSWLLSSGQDLSSILSQEIKHEQTVYEQDEALAQGPPAPFKLTSSPGDTTVTLTREFKGEKVSIDASINMQDTLALPFDNDASSDEPEDEPNDITFNVSVSKAGKALVFECISDGTYVDIRHVSLEPESGVESETSYTGPVFGELDDELQNAFRAYVAERGVNEDLGEYLRHLLYDKEQQEYAHWLEGVNSFVKSN